MPGPSLFYKDQRLQGRGSVAFVFFAGRHAAADVALLLICIQNLPYRFVQLPVMLWQSLLKIFMYGGF